MDFDDHEHGVLIGIEDAEGGVVLEQVLDEDFVEVLVIVFFDGHAEGFLLKKPFTARLRRRALISKASLSLAVARLRPRS